MGDNILCLVACGAGVSVEPSSSLGLVFPGVVFVPLDPDEDHLTWDAIWLATNEQHALRRFLELSGRLIRPA